MNKDWTSYLYLVFKSSISLSRLSSWVYNTTTFPNLVALIWTNCSLYIQCGLAEMICSQGPESQGDHGGISTDASMISTAEGREWWALSEVPLESMICLCSHIVLRASNKGPALTLKGRENRSRVLPFWALREKNQNICGISFMTNIGCADGTIFIIQPSLAYKEPQVQ